MLPRTGPRAGGSASGCEPPGSLTVTGRRLEARNEPDRGVQRRRLAIIITIMVLEIKVPDEPTWPALGSSDWFPHLCSASSTSASTGATITTCSSVERTSTAQSSGATCICFLALHAPGRRPPGSTSRVVSRIPVIVYGVNLLLAAIAYTCAAGDLQGRRRFEAPGRTLGRDRKGKTSPALYISGIVLALLSPWLGMLVFTRRRRHVAGARPARRTVPEAHESA